MKVIPDSLIVTAALVIAIGFVSSPCLSQTSQESKNKNDVVPRIEFDNVPLATAIMNLAREINLNYILDPRVPGSDFGPGRLISSPRVTALWTNRTAEEVLNTLLKRYKLTLVTNTATSIARIVPVGQAIKPPLIQQICNDTNIIPILVIRSVPLAEAIGQITSNVNLSVTFDPEITTRTFNESNGVVSFRWQKVTTGQALAVLIENYDLRLVGSFSNSNARILLDRP